MVIVQPKGKYNQSRAEKSGTQRMEDFNMKLGEKIKEARKNVGLTQAELAERLCVSRQAVTKWESGQGIPDVENLRMLAGVLDVSIDFLLDEGEDFNKAVIKEQIELSDYKKEGKLRSKQEAVVYEKYSSCEIIPLLAKKKSTKSQKIVSELLGWVFDAPFGTDQMYHMFGEMDHAYFLVEDGEKQIFVIVTKEFIESRVLPKKIIDNKFEIGEYQFTKARYRVEK